MAERGSTSGARIPALDGLRAMAAGMVFVFHGLFMGILGPLGLESGASVIDGLLRARDALVENLGIQGVALFYVLSGFLLYRPFLAARVAGRSGPGATGYAVRRAARIFPAYWVALTIIALADGRTEVFSLAGFLDYYLLAHIYSFATLYGNPIPSAWTLGVELSFYVFLLVWVLAIARLPDPGVRWYRREGLLIGTLAALSFAWLLWALVDPATRPHEFQPRLVALPSSLYVFAAGMWLAVLSVRLEGRTPGDEERAGGLVGVLGRYGWWLALGSFALMAMIGTKAGFGPEEWRLRVLIDSVLKVVVAVGLVSPVVLRARRAGLPVRLLGSRVALYLGLVSYGIYIWQLFVMSRVVGDFEPQLSLESLVTVPLAFLVTFGLTVAVASLSWFGVERWAISRAARVSRRRPGPDSGQRGPTGASGQESG